jgi:hypothetical protein
MGPSEREASARRLVSELPSGFAFHAIRPLSLGDQRHEVAMFDFDGARFALIPGGSIQLGYDADRYWEPSPEELASWQGTAEEYEIRLTIHEQIAGVTLRPRAVEIHPFLLETVAREVGWKPVPLDDPEVREILQEHRTGQPPSTSHGGETRTRIRRDADDSVTAERAMELTHADLAEPLRANGFRFPTSDEWEYACGGDTLFRWGDHVPCDRYPTDESPEEAAWRWWVLSGGKLEYPEGGFVSDWDDHRRPNAFGLFIASNP